MIPARLGEEHLAVLINDGLYLEIYLIIYRIKTYQVWRIGALYSNLNNYWY